MIKLNLLPPQEKEMLKTEQARRWVVFYGVSILSILGVFLVLLGAIWLSLNIQLKSVSNDLRSTQASFKGQDLQTQQKLIANLNNYLNEINTLQNSQKSYSGLLIHLASLMPEGTRLDGLIINEKNEITMSGFAPRREQVLELQNNLEKSDLIEVKTLESPPSNLVKQINIVFYFKFNLSTDAFKLLINK